jgi:ATP-dependent DNA ligase
LGDRRVIGDVEAEQYTHTLPASEGRLPLNIVVDVGHTIELYRKFTCTGGTGKASRWGSPHAEKMQECRWVKPLLVCRVEFVEWTSAGHLPHCHFVAMRDDKHPNEVVRET